MRPATSDIGASSGSAPCAEVDRLVGDADRAACDQVLRLIRIRRQVKEGEQHLAGRSLRALRRLRLFHLDDQLGRGEDLVRTPRQPCAGGDVLVVRYAGALPGAALDQHFVPVRAQPRARLPASVRPGTRGSWSPSGLRSACLDSPGAFVAGRAV